MKPLLFILILTNWTTELSAQNHSSDTSFVINKQNFTIVTRDTPNDNVLLIVYCNSKTVSIDTINGAGLSNIVFPDFNKDGYIDIMLTYMGNISTYFLYLFDSTDNRFKYLDGFDRFPEAKQLKSNSYFYYSYHRAGCSDLNWVSDLFTIDNFKTIYLGHIYGKGCEPNDNDDIKSIEVYKISNNKEVDRKLIERLTYEDNITCFAEKWDFIEKYWNMNYRKFDGPHATNR
jgi:hypothetical protein